MGTGRGYGKNQKELSAFDGLMSHGGLVIEVTGKKHPNKDLLGTPLFFVELFPPPHLPSLMRSTNPNSNLQ